MEFLDISDTPTLKHESTDKACMLREAPLSQIPTQISDKLGHIILFADSYYHQ